MGGILLPRGNSVTLLCGLHKDINNQVERDALFFQVFSKCLKKIQSIALIDDSLTIISQTWERKDLTNKIVVQFL